MKTKVLYLGPSGSYSELAIEKFKSLLPENLELIQQESLYQMMRYLIDINNDSLFAIVPIENSIEGIVRDTQDNLSLLAQKGIQILAETQLSIEHCLISFGKQEEIKTITSHPQALAQCREFIYKKWENNITFLPALSTSNAVANLSKETPYIAAIASEHCANFYNKPVLGKHINDKENNATRFVLLSKKSPQKTINNKVSIVFSTENKPGALNKVLNIFEKYDINMSYIDSRPSRRELGEYVFYVDFAGHIEDNNIALALVEIQPFIKTVEVLSKGAICI